MAKPVVVYIRSLAYSGTTWVNFVLGSHPDAFALGVPDRIWTGGAQEAARLCSIHGAACEFWPRYFERWDRPERAMSKLAGLSGARVIVLNNINMNLLNEHVVNDEVEMRYMVVLRDGRANVTSALRHMPEMFENRYHAMRTWLKPAWEHLFDGLPDDPALTLRLRYEDLVRDPDDTIARVGEFLGLDYQRDAFRFWEKEHHYIGGNTGTLGLLRDMRGLDRAEHAREDYYRELAENTRAAPETPVLDEKWRDVLTPRDIIAYDYLCGKRHESFGYARDSIAPAELEAFRAQYGLPEDPSLAPQSIAMDPPAAAEPATGAPTSWWTRLQNLFS